MDFVITGEQERDRQRLLDKLDLLESYLDDLKEKVRDHVNISEHSGDMRKLIGECRSILRKQEVQEG